MRKCGSPREQIRRLAETIYERSTNCPSAARRSSTVAAGGLDTYNSGGTHTDEAVLYIREQLRAASCAHGIPIPKKIEDDLSEDLAEMIYAGLT